MITGSIEKFAATVEAGLLDGLSIENIYSVCVRNGEISGKTPERIFIQSIQGNVFRGADRVVSQRAAEIMFCIKKHSGVTMRILPQNARASSRPSMMTMLLSDGKYNALFDRKKNALVGLNLLQEAISQKAIERDQIVILDEGEEAAGAGNDRGLITSGVKAWNALFMACGDGSLELDVFDIEEPAMRYFNDV